MSKINKLMDKFKKKYGDTTVFSGDENIECEIETISTGSLALDAALIVGGFPKGRVITVAGPEASGKTFLTMCAIAEAQKSGIQCAFIDAEYTFDANWATRLGIDVTKLIVARPEFMEDALQMIIELAKTGEVGLIVWDSVVALPTKQEGGKEVGEATIGTHAKALTVALRLLTPIISRNNVTCIFINQLREKIGVMFGDPITTPGGRALKHASSIVLHVTRVGGSELKNGTVPYGHKVRVRVKKNKMSTAQNIVVEFTIKYLEGIDRAEEALTVGVESGAIERINKSTYGFAGQTFRGKAALGEFLAENPDEVIKLRDSVIESMKKGFEATEDEAPDLELEDEDESEEFLSMED